MSDEFSEQLNFPDDVDWRSLPTTKVRRPKETEPFAWSYTYTAFSQTFAEAALKFMGALPGKKIFDPFMGSGTTLVAGLSLGCHVTGVDLSPFSALLTRARLSQNVHALTVERYLNSIETGRKVTTSGETVLSDADLCFAESVIYNIMRSTNLSKADLWKTLINDTSNLYDSEIVAILSLVLGARKSALLKKGTNPVWFKRSSDVAENSEGRPLQNAALNLAYSIISDLAKIHRKTSDFHIYNANISDVSEVEKYDICLTSPPYMNRLDYVMAHLPELSVLKLVHEFDFSQLQKAMIGTTRITMKGDLRVPSIWGQEAETTLRSIYNHSSRASTSYYYPIAYAYFVGLFQALKTTLKHMDAQGAGAIVVQNSFYKEIVINTPQICQEMCHELRCDAQIVHNARVRNHMGRMSPAQTIHVPTKELGEAIVHFKNNMSQ